MNIFSLPYAHGLLAGRMGAETRNVVASVVWRLGFCFLSYGSLSSRLLSWLVSRVLFSVRLCRCVGFFSQGGGGRVTL